MNDNDRVHLEWLQDTLARHETRLSEAESTVAKIRPIVANLHGVIDALVAEGQDPRLPQDMFESKALHQNGSQEAKTRVKPFTKGNQNPDMPARKPEFAESTLIEAAGKIIGATPNALHADDITKGIFSRTSKRGFSLAKHSLTSELARGAKNGLWAALGGNRFRRK